MTAVDRNQAVLEHASGEDDTRKVKFIGKDIREVDFDPNTFDSAIFLETSGLMSKRDDVDLFRKAFGWLKPGGKLTVDCPLSAEVSNSWSKTFPEGEVSCHSTFDAVSRMQRIEFSFAPIEGEAFDLVDPIRDNEKGISRYLYPKEELASVLESVGFSISEVSHYYAKNYYSFVATKN